MMHIVTVCLILFFASVKSFPIKEDDNKLEFKNEKRYSNGTVIGKYTYKDKEGNPVHVKYFADDSSYGVELKSAKFINTNSDDLIKYNLPKLNNMISTVDIFQQLDSLNTANAMLNKEYNKNKTFNPFDLPDSYPSKINRFKESNKANDDYEIFLENDLKPEAKCNKEKVKVYLDKNKRKNRNAPSVPYQYQPSDYCKRF